MEKTTFHLMIHENSQSKLIGPDIAQIYVNVCSRDETKLYITPHCYTMSELDEEIERFKKELERIRVEAKNRFRK